MRDKVTARTLVAALLATLGAGGSLGCSSSNDSSALPQNVKAIVFLQRIPRNDQGNVFDYTSFVAPSTDHPIGGRLVMLQPPAANGTLTVLTSDPMFTGSDIMSYDLSFDAKSIVFSARLADSQNYQLFSMNLDGTNIQQLTEGGNDFVYPNFLPGGKILFQTNRNVEADAPQFKDEYERAVTAQAGTINMDGTGMVLGARNVSHRVAPALLPGGQVVYTEWEHMGPKNDGHLRLMNSDMTGMREAFGSEFTGGGTNSYLKARYIQTTQFQDPDSGDAVTNVELVAIATSRDRTLQAGKLYRIDLNGSEKNSTFTDMTPQVPGDRTPSPLGVGRYYDAEPIGDASAGQFLVSWSDGPVESETLALAQSTAQFGIYLFDSTSGKRFPIYDDLKMWDVLARPVLERQEPTALTSPVSSGTTSSTFGSLNVYNSSLLTIQPGSVVKVRLIEGFSSEEGGVDMFGTTEFDGQSLYGHMDLKPDNSFAAQVPGNVPFHIQLVDKFAMSVANEPIWISGRAGEQRSCGGCHENRTDTTLIPPGIPSAMVAGAVNFDVPRAQRIAPTAFVEDGSGNVPAADSIRGVPWDKAIQPILDAKCVSCHGPDNKAGVPSYTVTDMTTGSSQTFNFDLSGGTLPVTVGERMTSAFTTSYISIMGLGEILGDDVVQITGTVPDLVSPASAHDSKVIQMLNPPVRYPAVDMNTRAFPGATHAATVGGTELTADEYYLLILNIDMGGQFFFRENLPTN
jgi:hypothetical protein